MKIAYKLTPAHLKPKGFQAMNVPLATEVCTFKYVYSFSSIK